MKEVRNLSVGLIEKDELISVELDSDFCSTKFGSVALLPPYALVIDYVNISSFCLVAMNSFFKTQWNLDKRKLHSTLTLLYIILLVLSELGRLACACFPSKSCQLAWHLWNFDRQRAGSKWGHVIFATDALAKLVICPLWLLTSCF